MLLLIVDDRGRMVRARGAGAGAWRGFVSFSARFWTCLLKKKPRDSHVGELVKRRNCRQQT